LFEFWKFETAFFNAFVKNPVAVSIPKQSFDFIGSFIPNIETGGHSTDFVERPPEREWLSHQSCDAWKWVRGPGKDEYPLPS